MRTLFRAVEFVVWLCLVVAVANLWTSRASAQLPRPGEDPRPMNSRIVGPLPLPVTGDVRVDSSTPVLVQMAAGRPLLVQVANAPSTAPPPFVHEGRCYFIDVDGDARWRDALWRIEDLQGPWVRVRPARAGSAAMPPTEKAWFNTARVSRISDAQPCE